MNLLSIISISVLLRDAQQLQEATALLWLAVLSPRCSSLLEACRFHMDNQCMLTACRDSMHIICFWMLPSKKAVSTFWRLGVRRLPV